MSEGGFSPEGGVPTYKPETPDKIRTMEQPTKGNWEVSKDQGQTPETDLNWSEGKKPDWAETSVADVDRPLKPSERIQKDVLRNLNPEPKKLEKEQFKK